MDKIILKGCRFYGYHGAFEAEQTLGQIFVIDVVLSLNLTEASRSDQLEDTVHYGQVFEAIKQETESAKYHLIERLAGVIIERIFDQFSAVQTIEITIKKENPPIAGHYNHVAISLERERP